MILLKGTKCPTVDFKLYVGNKLRFPFHRLYHVITHLARNNDDDQTKVGNVEGSNLKPSLPSLNYVVTVNYLELWASFAAFFMIIPLGGGIDSRLGSIFAFHRASPTIL